MRVYVLLYGLGFRVQLFWGRFRNERPGVGIAMENNISSAKARFTV